MALITPDYLQTKTYAAKRDRRVNQALVMQEGIWDFGHFKATQRGAGANMSVDIAAGEAWVDGDSSVDQGFYHVVNDATVNVAIANNASGNPRIDQIVLRVNDSADAGSGTDTPALEVIQGTPSAGATLANRTGAAAIPNTALKLADVLVANGAVKIENAQIGNLRDPRAGLTGYPAAVSPLSVAGAPAQYALGRPASYVPSVQANRSEAVGIGSGGATAIPFNIADSWDNENMHDIVTNNSRLTVSTPGFYVAQAMDSWSGLSGVAALYFSVNGSGILYASAAAALNHNSSGTFRLGYGDYLQAIVLQNDGVSHNITVCSATATWVAP